MKRNKRFLNGFIKTVGFSLLGLIGLILLVSILLQTEFVQQRLKKIALNYVREKVNTKVEIEHVKLSLFSGITIEKLYAEDEAGDSLLYLSSLKLKPKIKAIVNNKLIFNKLFLDSLRVNLYELNNGKLNFQFFADAFSGDSTQSDTAENTTVLFCKHIRILHSDIKYKTRDTTQTNGMNFNDLHLLNFNLYADRFSLNGDSIRLQLDSLTVKEQSGFNIQKLSGTEIIYSNTTVLLNDFLLKTDNSNLVFQKIRLDYPNSRAFSNFTDSVNMDIQADKDCYLGLSDAAFFSTSTEGLSNKLHLAGRIQGKLNQIQTRKFKINLDDIILLDIDSDISNLTDIENMQFNLAVNQLKIDFNKLRNLHFEGDSLIANLPEQIQNINKLTYNGNTRGESSDFKSDGIINTNIGKISLSLTAQKDSLSTLALKGSLKANNLEVNRIIDNNSFGKVTFFQNIDFKYTKDKKIRLKTQGKIDSLDYKNFRYRNVQLYAKMNDTKVDSASLIVNQKDVKLSILAKADLTPKIPNFEFEIYADTLNLKAMGIEPKHKHSFMAFAVNGKFKGITPEDFEGDIELTKPFVYKNDSLSIEADTLIISGETLNKDTENFRKKITLQSDIISGEITQQGKLSVIIDYMQQSFGKFMPSFFAKNAESDSLPLAGNEQLDFWFEIKKPEIIAGFIYPDIEFSKQGKIKGAYYAHEDSLLLSVNINAVRASGIEVDSLVIKSQTQQGVLHTNLSCKKVTPAEDIFLKNFELNTQIKNDSIHYNLLWANKNTEKYNADIKGLLNFVPYPDNKGMEIKSKIYPSVVTIADSVWQISESEIVADSLFIAIKNLNFKNKAQNILIDGSIITNKKNAEILSDRLVVTFTGFEMTNLSPLLGENLSLEGQLNGTTRLMQLLTKPVVLAENKISRLKVNGMNLGKLYLKTDWLSAEDKVMLQLNVEQGNAVNSNLVRVIETNGYYKPENDSLRLHAKLQSLKANTFRTYFQDFMSVGRSTQFNGIIDAAGTSKNLDISGNIEILSFLARIKYLNTQYNSTAGLIRINFDNEKIELLPTRLSSGKRNEKAELQGVLRHHNFKNFTTDFTLIADNLQLNNTPKTDTAYFYGPIYGSGTVKITGATDDLKIIGNLETDKNTRIYIPLSATETLTENNSFIQFVSHDTEDETIFKDSTEIQEENYTALSGLSIDMDIKLTPDAEIQLILDEATGDIIKMRGRSDMKLNVDTRGDITAFGDFVIEEGDYAFSLEGLINKKFKIRKGSKISLHGDPSEEGEMDISTAFTLHKVPIYNLMASDEYKGIKTTADCILNMKGKLLNPDISFDVKLRDVDEDIADQVHNLDSENKNIQFLSLLMISNFQPLPGFRQENVENAGVTGVVSAGDVLTTQINRLLSDISEDFDVGLNYEQDDKSSELALALSTNIWDDRITLNGNVGVGSSDRTSTTDDNTNNVVGEVEAEVKLNRKGNLKLKIYNKANDDLEYDKAPYTQGIGFFWRKQFNSLNLFKKDKNNKPDSLQNQ